MSCRKYCVERKGKLACLGVMVMVQLQFCFYQVFYTFSQRVFEKHFLQDIDNTA